MGNTGPDIPLTSPERDDPARPSSARVLRGLLFVFLLLTLAVVALTLQKYVRMKRSVSVTVIEEMTEQARTRTIDFFRPVGVQAQVLRRWGESGIVDTEQAAFLDAKLIPVLEQLPQVESLLILSRERLLYGLARGEPTGEPANRATGGEARPAEAWRLLGRGPDGPRESGMLVPAETEWFRRAVASRPEDVYVSRPHRLFPSSRLGITAAVAWDFGGERRVGAFNVPMEPILRLMDSVRISDDCRFYLFEGEEMLIDFQQPPGGTSVSDPVAKVAGEAWAGTGDSRAPFRFHAAGMAWWGVLVPIQEERNAAWIGILVPEPDLIAQRRPERYLYVLVALGIFWAGMWIYVRTRRREDREAARRASPIHGSEEGLLGLIADGESDRLEFKSTLRWNLKADRAGKEIELACLKTVVAFLNSDGGTLLVGVEDDGSVLGIGADRFENEDRYLRHFGNLFNQHIGLEASEHVEFALRTVGDKRILVVVCRRASRPVFLRVKNDEAFYVRSGPASRQLTTSQVLEYLEARE